MLVASIFPKRTEKSAFGYEENKNGWSFLNKGEAELKRWSGLAIVCGGIVVEDYVDPIFQINNCQAAIFDFPNDFRRAILACKRISVESSNDKVLNLNNWVCLSQPLTFSLFISPRTTSPKKKIIAHQQALVNFNNSSLNLRLSEYSRGSLQVRK